MIQLTLRNPAHCVADAKQALVSARYHRQQAQVHRDQALRVDDKFIQNRLIDLAEKEACYAEACREKARWSLKDHEISIGTYYALGIGLPALKERLNGKSFKEWSEYAGTFNKRLGKVDIW